MVSADAPSEHQVIGLAGQVDGFAARHQQQKSSWDLRELAWIADSLGQQKYGDPDRDYQQLDTAGAQPACPSPCRWTHRLPPLGEEQPARVDLAGEQLIENDQRKRAEEEQDFNLQDGGD